ncbi:helix-turn-helix transcriptional regulator [Haloferax namakaokahaiae]|uniref:Helix-turn-helix transcriptional regulator n=1 Tax=Haloferax namakaokahaiae TaxID=1748331 RepID=A0ABD5ZD38_9EURY
MTETKALLRLFLRRDEVIAQVRAGPIDIRSLTDAVDVSRPTVHRSLKELQEHDIVAETTGGYVVTSYGELLFERYRSFLSEFGDMEDHRELLMGLDDASSICDSLLEGATYTKSVPFAPEKPISEVEAFVRGATTVRGFTPFIVERYAMLFHDQVTSRSLDAEILTSRPVFDYTSVHWQDQLEEAIAAGLEYLVVEDSFPFGLLIAEEPDEAVCVIVDDNGTLRGVIQNDNPDAVEWGRNLYEQYRTQARYPDPNVH